MAVLVVAPVLSRLRSHARNQELIVVFALRHMSILKFPPFAVKGLASCPEQKSHSKVLVLPVLVALLPMHSRNDVFPVRLDSPSVLVPNVTVMPGTDV